MAVAVVERWPSWRRAVSGGSTLRTSFETQGSYLDGAGGGGKKYCKGWKSLTTVTQDTPPPSPPLQAHRHLDSRLLISFTAILARPVSSRELKSF